MNGEVAIEDPGIAALPHRAPFLFVRTLKSCVAGESAEGTTWFAEDDELFKGHFPGRPIVPGVILTEALAQIAGVAAASGYHVDKRPGFLLSAIRGMKFFRAVHPRENITLRARRLAEMGELLQFAVEARVGEEKVAEGQLVLSREEKHSALG